MHDAHRDGGKRALGKGREGAKRLVLAVVVAAVPLLLLAFLELLYSS